MHALDGNRRSRKTLGYPGFCMVALFAFRLADHYLQELPRGSLLSSRGKRGVRVRRLRKTQALPWHGMRTRMA